MTDRPDPKEVKLLADILALVLEDHPGQSTTALDTIRRRAQASRVTGGAIKNLFLRLTTGQLEAEAGRAAERAQGAAEHLHRELDAAKRDIAALQGERHRLQQQLATMQAQGQDALEHQRGSLRVGLACGAIAMLALVLVFLGVQALRAVGQAPQEAVVAALAAPPAPPAPAPMAAAPAPSAAPAQPTAPAAVPAPAAQANAQATAGAPALISAAARQAIGEHVRSCWIESGGVARPATASFDIEVQVDGTGTVRTARLTGEDQAARNDPNFRIFAQRALHALVDPRCATLPLPLAMLGRPQTLDFHFAP